MIKSLTVWIVPVAVLQQCADHQDHGGEEDEEEGDDGHNPGPETEAGILEQIPPPLLGPAQASVGEDVHIVLLPLGGFLHLILAAVVYFLAARLHKQFTDAPECQLFTEERCNDETNDEWEMNNLVLREILRL